MTASIRPYATASVATTASVALVAAGLIGVSPVEPQMTDLQTRSAAVQLAADFDPITPWVEVFDNSRNNWADLANMWLDEPLPVVRQVLSNQLTYLLEFPDVALMAQQVWDNIGAGIRAPFVADPDLVDSDHSTAFAAISAIASLNPTLAALVSFTASPVGGILIGNVGLAVGPVLALMDSIDEIGTALSAPTPDWVGALNALVNIPAEMTDAFLNGGKSIDLTALLQPLADLIPGVTSISGELEMAGLLSGPSSIFNSVGLTTRSGPIATPGFNFDGVPAGPFGTAIAMSNAIAAAIKVPPPAPASAPPTALVSEVPQSGRQAMLTVSTEALTDPVVEDTKTADTTANLNAVDNTKSEKQTTRAEKRAERQAAKAEKKAERQAANAEKKAERQAAKAEKKAERKAAKAEKKAAKASAE